MDELQKHFYEWFYKVMHLLLQAGRLASEIVVPQKSGLLLMNKVVCKLIRSRIIEAVRYEFFEHQHPLMTFRIGIALKKARFARYLAANAYLSCLARREETWK
jgi:hypothetical protein